MTNDHSFLSNVRAALDNDPHGGGRIEPDGEIFAVADHRRKLMDIRHRPPVEYHELIRDFLTNGEAKNCRTHLVRSLEEAADQIVQVVRESEVEFGDSRHIMVHDHPDLAAMELWRRFSDEPVTVHTSFADDLQRREKTIASFIGITCPAIGVADSATLVEILEPGRPAATSLVPSIHIAFLRTEALVANLDEAYALLDTRADLGNFIFISGPSKTADIEAHLVHGAHGPREVHLVVLDSGLEQSDSLEV